ncbi:MAG TPA: hypothetical protein VH560_03520 [Polyangia bacterium]|nr:hypothetical protein [Polyangia bacterium]
MARHLGSLIVVSLGIAACSAKSGGIGIDAATDASALTGACTPPADMNAPFAKLSQTGCVDPNDPTKLASIVTSYEVNSPLWSDGADKERGFVLPAGAKIHVKDCATPSAECTQGAQDTGKWVMPVGTVMVKTFMFDGKRVETRLLVHADAATWNGYSYQWNEAQTDATIVPDDRVETTFDTGQRSVDWHFPNRFDCTTCHTLSAGGTLGPETRQMNRAVGGMNQIDRWKTAGLFEGAGPPTPYQAALVLPYDGQLGTVPADATTEARARSYLHANCAYCHRPDGDFAAMDLRFDTPLANMGVCNVAPMKSDLGVTGAFVLTPGMPMASILWLRMHSPRIDEKTRMPQLATYVVDDAAVGLVADWITSITACP